MTLKEIDAECTKLFRELDAMKAAGEDSSIQGSKYMTTLYKLRDLTAARIGQRMSVSTRS